jgi:renalase
LSCARRLAARGAKVTVFEQGRRPGGRASTLRTEFGNFDHGAPYFIVQNHAFERVVAQWLAGGVVQRWAGRIIAVSGETTEDKSASMVRYVGSEGMISVGSYLAEGLDVRLDTRIGSIMQTGARWSLLDDTERAPSPGGFDALVLAMPSAQAAQLNGVPVALLNQLRAVQWQPCWTAQLALQVASGFDFSGAMVVNHSTLAWAMREHGDSDMERWVLHATPRWSSLHLNLPSDDVASLLAQALAERFNFGFRPAFVSAHRWMYAAPSNALPERYLWIGGLRIGAIGDWCLASQIEGAYLSGAALGAAIVP